MSSPNAQWLIFDTHPIQYRSPVFSQLSKQLPGVQVYFFNENFRGDRPWFHEVGSIPKQTFNVELREGFASEVLNSNDGLVRFTKNIWRLFGQDRPRGVLMYGWYLPEHWILWGICRLKKIPLIFVGETFSKGVGWRRMVKNVLHPLFFSGVSQAIAIGEKTRRFYESLKFRRVTGAKYCTDTRFFEASAAESAALRMTVREELGIPSEALTLVFVARLFERKRPHDLLELHQKLSDLGVHTLMIGNGPMENELRSASETLSNFHFLGFQDQPSLRRYYQAADLLVVPSRYETWGLVVNEAFASGLTALVTDTCGCADDLVLSGETGFIYPMGDVAAAARLLEPFVRNPNLLEPLKKRAKEKVSREYSIEQFSDSIRSAFLQATT